MGLGLFGFGFGFRFSVLRFGVLLCGWCLCLFLFVCLIRFVVLFVILGCFVGLFGIAAVSFFVLLFLGLWGLRDTWKGSGVPWKGLGRAWGWLYGVLYKNCLFFQFWGWFMGLVCCYFRGFLFRGFCYVFFGLVLAYSGCFCCLGLIFGILVVWLLGFRFVGIVCLSCISLRGPCPKLMAGELICIVSGYIIRISYNGL